MRFRDRPVEQKIFLTILPICLLPAIVFLGLVIIGLRLTFERAMGRELERGSTAIAENFDRYLEGEAAALRTAVVRSEALRGLSAEQLAAWGGAIPETYRPQGLLLLEDNGTSFPGMRLAILDPELEPLRAALLGDVGWYREWLANPARMPAEGLLTDHALYTSTHNAEPPRLVYFLMITTSGIAIGIDQPLAFTQRLRRTLPNPPDDLYIYSSSLFPIETESRIPAALAQSLRSAMEDRSVRGDWSPISAGARRLLLAGAESQRMKRLATGFEHPIIWTFILPYDMEIFLGPQDSLIWLAVLLVLVLVLMMLGVAVYSSRWIVSPLLKLRSQADALAQGNLDVQVDITSRDEVGRVAEAFNIMTGRLRKSYASLEERLEENRLHTEHIYVLNQITGAIIQALSLERIFEILCDDLHKICAYDAIWIALFDRDENDLTIAHISPAGLITHFDRGRIPARRSLHGRVVSTSETHQAEISAHHREEFFETQIFNSEGLQSFVIAPLPGRDGIIGTLSIAATQPDAYAPELSMIMTSLANAVAVAIEQTTLFQQISQMATELERKVADRTEELRRATRKLLQTEKYFATGRMAGNLGHEINNPLGIIKNYLSLARANLERSSGGRRGTDPNADHLRIIDEEVNRIARLVRQLLDLHRPVEHRVAPVDLNALLEDILALMEEDMRGAQIEIVRDFDPHLPHPMASADLLRQLFINLLRNAQDAMDSTAVEAQAGKARKKLLTLRTSSVVQWEDGRELHAVCIRVADNGCGIPAEHLSQIFDPFFTTKASEQGSGLGLSISFGIVRMYQGSIDVESRPGEGTSFLITLPLTERQAPVGSETTSLAPDPAILW